MYKVRKERGYSANLTLENTDTMANLIIGRVTMEILKILRDAGHKVIGEDELMLQDPWEFEVNEDVAKELSRYAMPIRKPIRDQRKVKAEEPKKSNKEIDAMDVLLGLANYN